MLRVFTLIASAAWISAVLMVSPIVAALECWRCCNSCEVAQSSCCTSKGHTSRVSARKVANTGGCQDRCPSCPKCQIKRPIPATVSGTGSWKLILFAAETILARGVDAVPEERPSFLSGRAFVDRSTPPPRVLFCTWRE